MTLGTLAIPLRAASNPRAGNTEKTRGAMDERRPRETRPLGLISVVGQPSTAETRSLLCRRAYVNAQDPEWIREQRQSCKRSSKQRG